MSRRLKYELLSRGLFPSDAALAALPLARSGMITVRDYPTTSGLVLGLGNDLFANARLRPDRPDRFTLDHDGGGFLLRSSDGGEVARVEVHPPPRYALESTRLKNGASIRMVAMTHADRVRLTPLHGCAFDCQFCNYPALRYRDNSVDVLAEALEIALADRIMPNPHVLVSGGTPKAGEYDYLNRLYAELPGRFPHLKWDLMLAPRGVRPGVHSRRSYAELIRRLKADGFDALSINLELFSPGARERFIPKKHEIGRENYFLFLDEAVKVFGPGKVRSVLLVGLEPHGETLAGVEALAAHQVLVELSPFTADPGVVLAAEREPTADLMDFVFEAAMERTQRAGMPMRPFCAACSHNIL